MSESIYQKDHNSFKKGKICVSCSRIEGSQKIASKRFLDDAVLSLPGVSTCESSKFASKKRKSAINMDSNGASNSGSSTNAASEGSESPSPLNIEDESDDEERWFNSFVIPILDELEKTDVTKSFEISSPSSSNSRRALAKNGTVTKVDSKERNADKGKGKKSLKQKDEDSKDIKEEVWYV